MDLRQYWFPAWIWFIIFLINFVWSCSPRPAFAAPLSSPECGLDTHCPYGQYCNFQTRSCVNCTDCSKFKLAPGRRICARGKEECGSCEVGFVMDEGGHCAADPTIPHSKNSKSDSNSPTSTTDPKLIWSVIVVGVIALFVLLLLGCLTFIGAVIYKRKFNSPLQPQTDTELAILSSQNAGNEREGKKQRIEVAELPEEYEPPPPYNIMGECGSRIYPEIQNERVALLGAVPGGLNDYGNFPAEIYFVHMEEDGVVPDPEQDQAMLAIAAAAIAPPEPSTLTDEEISATMFDMSQLISEQTPTQQLEINQSTSAPEQVLNTADDGTTSETHNPDALPLPNTNFTSTVNEVPEGQNVVGDLSSSEENQPSEGIPGREYSMDLTSAHSSMVTSTPRQGVTPNDSGNSSPFPFNLNLIFDPDLLVQVANNPTNNNQHQQPVEHPDFEALMDEGIDNESSVDSDYDEEDPHGRVSRVVPDQTTEDYNSFLEDAVSPDDLSMVE